MLAEVIEALQPDAYIPLTHEVSAATRRTHHLCAVVVTAPCEPDPWIVPV
jgi:hypothetical protein